MQMGSLPIPETKENSSTKQSKKLYSFIEEWAFQFLVLQDPFCLEEEAGNF